LTDLIRSIGRQLAHLIHFLVAVLRKFRANKGILLAGGVGYNTLLSIIPLFILVALGLSHIIEPDQLVQSITHELRFIVPGHADRLAAAIARFLEQRNVFGSVVLFVLLFFSSIAFRTFESALEIIFDTPGSDRHFLVSFLLPYAFVALLGLSVIALTAVTAVLESLAGERLRWFQYTIEIPAISNSVIYALSFLGLIAIFTVLYKTVPAARVSGRNAAIGAVFAAVLWEAVRGTIVWYFANISVVNLVYGSLTTVVIVLLTMEVASVILLLGAQVIAELERNAARGDPWYGDIDSFEPPSDDPPS